MPFTKLFFMASTFIDVFTVGGDLQIFSNPGTQPDIFAHLITKSQIAGAADLLLWRSMPPGGGVNTNPFRVVGLEAWPKPSPDPVVNSIPQYVPGGKSKFSMGAAGAAAQKDLNVWLTVAYMQYPPTGWPTPAGYPSLNADPGDPQGFHYYEDPIGAVVPRPVRPGTSCWAVVMAMDSPQRLGFAGSAKTQTYEFRMTCEPILVNEQRPRYSY